MIILGIILIISGLIRALSYKKPITALSSETRIDLQMLIATLSIFTGGLLILIFI